jgi:hypothetical protein
MEVLMLDRRLALFMSIAASEFARFDLEYLDIVKPGKKDNVKIVSGEYRGQIGHLIGVDGVDGIVKLRGGSGFKIMGMTSVAKYTGSEAVA